MKTKRIVPVHTVDREEEHRCICDICGKGVYRDNDEIEVRAMLGDVYDGDDCRDVEEFDCCGKCWKAKVVPALEAIGLKVYRYDAYEGRLKSMPLDTEAK